jgi:hypothetical protein
VPDPRFLAVNDEGLSRSNLGDLLDSCKIQCDSLGPSNAGARAAISFVEKCRPSYGSTLLAKGHEHARHDYGPDSQIHPLSSASVGSFSFRRPKDAQGLAHTKCTTSALRISNDCHAALVPARRELSEQLPARLGLCASQASSSTSLTRGQQSQSKPSSHR